MESASVLAVGPLSGVGARIRALGAITTRTTVKLAAFFGTMVAGAFVFYKVTQRAIMAGLEFERIAGALNTVTKNAALTYRLFDQLADIAVRFGVNLETSSFQFAKLTASAKGTSVGLKTLKDVYEGISAAIATFRIDAQSQEKIFRAVTQMLSKGKAQAEEVRNQFAEHLPGAFGVLAKSMGYDTEEFSRRMERGLIAAEEVVHGIATFKDIFKESGEAASQTLAKQLDKLVSNWFRLGLAIDKATGLSKRATGVIMSLNEYLNDLRLNTRATIDDLVFLGSTVAAAFGYGLYKLGRAITLHTITAGKASKAYKKMAIDAQYAEAATSRFGKLSRGAVAGVMGLLTGIKGLILPLAAATAAFFAFEWALNKFFKTSENANVLDKVSNALNLIDKIDFKETGLKAYTRQVSGLNLLDNMIKQLRAEKKEIDKTREDIGKLLKDDKAGKKAVMDRQPVWMRIKEFSDERDLGLQGRKHAVEDLKRLVEYAISVAHSLKMLEDQRKLSGTEFDERYYRLTKHLKDLYTQTVQLDLKSIDARYSLDAMLNVSSENNATISTMKEINKQVGIFFDKLTDTRSYSEIHKALSLIHI